MKELPLDERGYPIPYFVPIINGKPEFRYQDGKKRASCISRNLCAICGKKLYDKSYWFICGPLGFANRVHSDSAMHEDCARYSINVCPHLVYAKAQRKSEVYDNSNPNMLRYHPDTLFLVKADKFSPMDQDGHTYITFRPKYHEQYVYQNNKLTLKK